MKEWKHHIWWKTKHKYVRVLVYLVGVYSFVGEYLFVRVYFFVGVYLFEEYFLWECIYLSECIYGSLFIYLWEDIYLREYIYLASKCICGSMRRVVWWEEEEGVWREEEIINLGTLCLAVAADFLMTFPTASLIII